MMVPPPKMRGAVAAFLSLRICALRVVEVWATPLPPVAEAVPEPEPEPVELRGEVLTRVDRVRDERELFSLAASNFFCTRSTTISSGSEAKGSTELMSRQKECAFSLWP